LHGSLQRGWSNWGETVGGKVKLGNTERREKGNQTLNREDFQREKEEGLKK